MGLKKCSAALVTSDDFWYHNPDTFDEDTKLFKEFGVVKADIVDKKKTEEENLEKCSYYFEIGKEDNHGFKTTNLRFDEKEGFLMVVGEQAPMGKEKQRVFQIGEEARRYKHMGGPRHTVDNIIVSNKKDKAEIKEFIEGMDKMSAEDFEAENINQINPTIVEGSENIMEAENIDQINPTIVEGSEDIMGAEEYNADNMNQINPTFVEGSEDIMGAEVCACNAEDCESCMGAESFSADDVKCNVCGRWEAHHKMATYDEIPKYRTGVCKQCMNEQHGAESFAADGLHVSGAYVHFDSESDSNTWAVEVQSEQGGSFLADMNTGSILHTSGDFAAEDIQALSAEDISNYLNIAAESQATPHYNMGPDDVVELVQKTSPIPINGWAASAIVVGLSAIVGAKLLNR